MHAFADLIDRSTVFSLGRLRELSDQTLELLQTSSARGLVQTLQMIRLHKAIMAVGMFSIFESMLQRGLGGGDGFGEATRLLRACRQNDLAERFEDFQLGVNVLKHGRGRSYDALVARAGRLPFRLMLPDEGAFSEGDVSEVSVLIDIDDEFLTGCSTLIREVSDTLRTSPTPVFI